MNERTMQYMKKYADSAFIPRVDFELIPIKELTCNQVYQRELSEKQVRKTSDNFDPFQINPVKVSKRDGKNYVIDGQHTMEIIAKISGSRETPVWCMVYDNLEYKKEANVFAEQTKYKRQLTSYEIFIAKVESGDNESLMIKTLVETYNLVIGKVKKPGMVCAVKSLEFIYANYGMEALSRTLRIIINTWGGDPLSLSASMLKGLALLLAAFEDKINDAVFIDKLSVVSLKELIRGAKDHHGGPMGCAEAMLGYYNKKSRSPLSVVTLYDHKSTKSKAAEKEEVLEKGLDLLEKQKDECEALDKALSEYSYYEVLEDNE